LKKSEAQKIYSLLNQWTRCEIISRHGQFDNLEFAQYAVKKIEIENRIRKILYGSSDLVRLGIKWELLKPKIKRRKKKKRDKNKRQHNQNS